MKIAAIKELDRILGRLEELVKTPTKFNSTIFGVNSFIFYREIDRLIVCEGYTGGDLIDYQARFNNLQRESNKKKDQYNYYSFLKNPHYNYFVNLNFHNTILLYQ